MSSHGLKPLPFSLRKFRKRTEAIHIGIHNGTPIRDPVKALFIPNDDTPISIFCSRGLGDEKHPWYIQEDDFQSWCKDLGFSPDFLIKSFISPVSHRSYLEAKFIGSDKLLLAYSWYLSRDIYLIYFARYDFKRHRLRVLCLSKGIHCAPGLLEDVLYDWMRDVKPNNLFSVFPLLLEVCLSGLYDRSDISTAPLNQAEVELGSSDDSELVSLISLGYTRERLDFDELNKLLLAAVRL